MDNFDRFFFGILCINYLEDFGKKWKFEISFLKLMKTGKFAFLSQEKFFVKKNSKIKKIYKKIKATATRSKYVGILKLCVFSIERFLEKF